MRIELSLSFLTCSAASNKTLNIPSHLWPKEMCSKYVFTPKCPINPPPCPSCNNKRRTELDGMHSLLERNTSPSLSTNLFHVLPSLQFCNTSLNSASCTY